MAVVSDIIKNWAYRQPDKPALISAGGTSLTYSQLYRLCECIAGSLATQLDVSDVNKIAEHKTSPVVLLCDDDPVSVATVIACNILGLTVVPLNPKSGSEALTAALNATNAGLILHSRQYRKEAMRLALTSPGAVDIHAMAERNERLAHSVLSDEHYPYLLSLSSGSTGDPKPVTYTDSGKLQRALSTADEFGFTQNDVMLCASPFYHSLGQRLTFMPLVLGATMVQLPRFSASAWLNAVAQHQVSVTICVSSHLFALKQSLIEEDPRADSIRTLVSSSASIDSDTKARLFESRKFEFFEMYGASEVATATRLASSDPVEKRQSVGKACKRVLVRVVDEERKELAFEQTGEIAIQSPLCTPGYYDRPDLDARAFDSGWFYTGDLGYIDKEGYLYFVDRCSDVINSGGSNIFPSDIEACLREHPMVVDCLVLGVKDSYLGEAAIAVVVCKKRSYENFEHDLRRYVRGSLAPLQQPLMYFQVNELPLNGAGKIDRKRVRAHYNEMDLNPSARFAAALHSSSGT